MLAAPPGHKLTDPQYKKLVRPTIQLAEQVPQTVGVSGTNLKSPLTLSKDETIGFADIHFAVPVDKLSQQTKDALERVAGPARKAGLEVEFSGGVISTSSSGSGSSDIIGAADRVRRALHHVRGIAGGGVAADQRADRRREAGCWD